MPIPDPALTNPPTRISETRSGLPIPLANIERVDPTDEGVSITFRIAELLGAAGSFSALSVALKTEPQVCSCEEDYMCALHGTGALPQDVRPDWADVARWKHARDVGLLAHTLEDLAGMTAASAAELARTLIPRDGVPVDVEAAVVTRAELRELAENGGPTHAYRAARFLAVSGPDHTRWDTFLAGIRAAAEYRRG